LKKGEIGYRKLHNKELNKLYYSPNIISIMKSKRMRWTWKVERMERRGIYIRYFGGNH
jgi:hypothetical protein